MTIHTSKNLIKLQRAVVFENGAMEIHLKELPAVGDERAYPERDVGRLQPVRLLVVDAHDLSADSDLRLVIPIHWCAGRERLVEVPETHLPLVILPKPRLVLSTSSKLLFLDTTAGDGSV